MNKLDKGDLLILAAALLFGTAGTARALAPDGLSPAFIGALRLFIGGPILLAISASGMPPGALNHRSPLLPILLAAAGVALFQICFFTSVARTGVAVGTIVAIGCAPMAAGILAAVFYGEPVTPRWLTAVFLSVSGCMLLGIGGSELVVDKTGVLLAAASGCGYAVYQVAGKRLVKIQSPDRAMAVVLCIGALMMTPYLVKPDLAALVTVRGITTALYLGIFATAMAYALFARGLKTVPVPRAAVLALAEPLMATLLGIFILDEQLTGTAFIGIALIISGLLLLTGNKPARQQDRRGDSLRTKTSGTRQDQPGHPKVA